MDYQKIGEAAAEHNPVERKMVKNRVLQLDADFLCYVSDPEQNSAQSDFKAVLRNIEFKRKRAGAEHVNACLTLGAKSGREEMAKVKPYQENRDGENPRRERAKELRTMLVNHGNTETMTICHDLSLEADDLLLQLQKERIAFFGRTSSVTESGDKDLWMGEGDFIDPKTGRLECIVGYGFTEYRDVGNKEPKLTGRGRSWFWHQMVMGDSVDNIPGLERLSNITADRITPLKSRKPRKVGSIACGEAKAVLLLKDVLSDREAANLVWRAYQDYYTFDAEERFVEQAYLLWMQRTDNPWDCIDYINNMCGLSVKPTGQQLEIVNQIKEVRKHVRTL